MTKQTAGRSSARQLPQQRRERRAVEIVAALVEDDDRRPLGNDIGDGDRLLHASPLGLLRAALANLDDLDLTQAQRASDRLRALAIRFGKLAFRSLLQAADSDDDETHGASFRARYIRLRAPRLGGPDNAAARPASEGGSLGPAGR